MALTAADLATIGDAPVAVQSVAFPNVYLRTDGRGVTSATSAGSGTVNCQFGRPSPWESYRVHRQANGSVALESIAFPGVYLRMGGEGVTATLPAGGGTVNCQFGAGPSENYHVRDQAGGSVALESAAFANVHMRMDGGGVTSYTGPGGGTVNCQFGVASYEKFFLVLADQHLDFAIQAQQQNNWCWAATSASVASYFEPATNWTQCAIADAEVGPADCCGAGAGGETCNKPWFLDTALDRVGHFRQFSGGALSTTQVGVELASSTPVGVRIGWNGGGGHFVIVRGRFRDDNGVEYVSVSDPWGGVNSDVTYNAFRNNYLGAGTWTHSYRTQS